MSFHRCLHPTVTVFMLFGLTAVQFGGAVVAQSVSTAGVQRSLFQNEPNTPDKLLSSARIAQRQDRITEARSFLAALLERDPRSPEMVALRQQYGLAPFILMRIDQRLQPEATDLLLHMQAAVPESTPAELEQTVARLVAGREASQRSTVLLLSAGDAALPALLAADLQTPAGQAADLFLQEYCSDLRGGLLELLNDADQPTQLRILRLLAGCDSPDVAEHLLRWQYIGADPAVRAAAAAAVSRLSRGALATDNAQQAASLLLQRTENTLSRFAQQQNESSGAELTVDPDPRLTPTPLQFARLRLTWVREISPEDPAHDLLADVLIAAAASPNADAQPGELIQRSASQQIAVLHKCLQLNLGVGAVEALRCIGVRDLQAGDLAGLQQALHIALQSSDARVRIAAVLQLRSRQLTLDRAADRQLLALQTGGLRPEAVIIGPDDSFRLKLRHLLEDEGFTVDESETGPVGFETAAAQMRCELVMLSLTPSRWPAAVTLANLRADLRTKQTPVVLFGPPEKRITGEALAAEYEQVYFLTTPIGQLTFPAQLRSLNLPTAQLSETDRSFLQSFVR